jgi:2-iminoacetate synthase ThiH
VEEIVKIASAAPKPAALFFCGAGSHQVTIPYLKGVFEAVGKALPSAELRGLSPEDLATVAERSGIPVARAAGELAESGFARLDAILPIPSGDDENAPLPGSTLSLARWTSIVNDAAGQGILVTAAPLVDSKTTPEDWMRVLKAVRGRTRPFADFAPLYIASETREAGEPDIAVKLKLFYAAARLYFAHLMRSISFNWDGADPDVAASVVRAGVNAMTLFDLSSTTGRAAPAGAERALEEIVVASGRKALPRAACK